MRGTSQSGPSPMPCSFASVLRQVPALGTTLATRSEIMLGHSILASSPRGKTIARGQRAITEDDRGDRAADPRIERNSGARLRKPCQVAARVNRV
jgi:hypothetical protein